MAAIPSSASRLPPKCTSTGTSTAPIASPAMVSPSRRPNTWPSEWAGTERCSSDRLATSSRARLVPATVSNSTVPAGPRPDASVASAPLSSSAAPRIGPPRRLRTSSMLTAAARSAPAPYAEFR